MTSATATDAQFSNFINGQFQAHRGLGEAISLLNTRFKLTGDPDERTQINDHVAELDQQRIEIEADRTAFMSEMLVVVPPSDDAVAELKAIADRLDRTIAASTVASDLLQLAGQIAGIWAGTKPGGG